MPTPGVPLEWPFVLDAFQAERDQAIAIGTAIERIDEAVKRLLRHVVEHFSITRPV